ncbi:WUSCHEL-related homeobox 9 [Cryptomeria japonica]|uniref:WUSCHEL-related homeobox 9 n=1 Tax=Cryptomeria japonica TaxID=3369 RepID=UPI0027DA45B4|nr:WUSCHEL-related homeobox 9 [Cryptomeria japonica]
MAWRNHWPNLFKVNPSPPQRQISTSLTMSTEKASAGEGTSSPRATEENTQLKKKWSPLPQQKEILEEIFKSGKESPDVDDIQKITRMLQAYGNVREASIFYWFQNRKTKEKKKQRLDSECTSMPSSGEISPPPMPPPQQTNAVSCARCQNAITAVAAIMNDSTIVHTERGERNRNVSALTVFINGTQFDASVWPINVKARFGEGAILLHSSGQPVLVDHQGFILKELEHGGVYKLVYV